MFGIELAHTELRITCQPLTTWLLQMPPFRYHNDCTNSCYTCPLTLTPSGAVAHSLSVT
jgi:hypothetical protein